MPHHTESPLRRAMRAADGPTGGPFQACAALRAIFALGIRLDPRFVRELEERLGPDVIHFAGGTGRELFRATDRLRRMHARFDIEAPPRTDDVTSRLDQLAKWAKLDDLERDILALCGDPLFAKLAEEVPARAARDVRPEIVLLAKALRVPEERVASALAPSATLRRAGLVYLDADDEAEDDAEVRS